MSWKVLALLCLCALDPARAGAGDGAEGPLFPVRKDGRWGFIDRSGAVAIPPRFDAVEPFSEGLASVREGKKLGYVDRTGSWALVPEQEPADALHRPFRDGRAAVKVGGRVGFVDRTGRLAVPARYLRADDFSDGFSLACSEQGCGFVDADGSYFGSDMFMGGRPFRDGFATVWLAMGMNVKRAVFVSRAAGRIPFEYEDTGDYAEGLAPVRYRWKWGYVDEAGKPVIQNRFDEAAPFSEGLAAVRPDLNGPCGYVDRGGAFAIAPRFATCGPFRSGLARVDLAAPGDAAALAFVDRRGTPVFAGADAEPPFLSAADFSDGLAAVGTGSSLHNVEDGSAKLGYVDAKGRYVWLPTR